MKIRPNKISFVMRKFLNIHTDLKSTVFCCFISWRNGKALLSHLRSVMKTFNLMSEIYYSPIDLHPDIADVLNGRSEGRE